MTTNTCARSSLSGARIVVHVLATITSIDAALAGIGAASASVPDGIAAEISAA